MALYTIHLQKPEKRKVFVKARDYGTVKAHAESLAPLKRGWSADWVQDKRGDLYRVTNKAGRSLTMLGEGAFITKGIPTGMKPVDLDGDKPKADKPAAKTAKVKENPLLPFVSKQVIVRFNNGETQTGLLTARADQEVFRCGKFGGDFAPSDVASIVNGTISDDKPKEEPKAAKRAKAPKATVYKCDDTDTLDHVYEGERMKCDDCGKPIHYNYDAEEYEHCDGSSCFLIGGKPVEEAKPKAAKRVGGKQAGGGVPKSGTRVASGPRYNVPDLYEAPVTLDHAKKSVENYCASDFKRGWSGAWGGRGGLSYIVRNSKGETQYTVSIKAV